LSGAIVNTLQVMAHYESIGPRGRRQKNFGWIALRDLPPNARIHVVEKGYDIVSLMPYRTESVPPFTHVRWI
jgi:hypothetical protein